MSFAQDRVESLGSLLDLRRGDVGQAVEYIDPGIDSSHHFGNFVVEPSVSAETEVYNHAVEFALNDVSGSHSGARSTAALGDACAIPHNGLHSHR